MLALSATSDRPRARPWLWRVVAASAWVVTISVVAAWVAWQGTISASASCNGSDFQAFCRAAAADRLLADLGRLGLVFIGGAVVISVVSFWPRGRQGGREHTGQRGQSMLEFALVAPLFFFLLFGIVEFGLLMFDVATSRFAAGEAARVVAQVGISSADCTVLPGCSQVYGPTYLVLYNQQGCDVSCQATTPPLCDADCQAIVAAHRTALGFWRFEVINYVDIQQMQANSDSTFSPIAGSCQRYNWDGSLYTGGATPDPGACSTYPGSARNVFAGGMDYVQVNVNFTYRWLTGIFSRVARNPTLDAKFVVRLEPQKFAAPAGG